MTAKRENPTLAIALMVLATVFIAATTLLAKALGTDTLGPPLHALQISQGRFIFALMAIGSVAVLMRAKIRAPNMKLHLRRTLLGWAGVSLMFASVAFIPLTDASAISFLNPVFAMILAIFVLGEKVGRIRWTAAAIALIGALILLRPGPSTFQPAALLALGAAMLFGIEITIIKFLSGREKAIQILLINNMLGVCIATFAASFVWQMPTALQWAALASLGIFMAMAQTCFVHSLARADSSLVVPFSYGTLVFATLYDLLIYDVVPDVISISGAVVIIAGAALLAFREAQLARSR